MGNRKTDRKIPCWENDGDAEINDESFKYIEAIIGQWLLKSDHNQTYSTTVEKIELLEVLKDINEVNQLIKQFSQMSKMMKMMREERESKWCRCFKDLIIMEILDGKKLSNKLKKKLRKQLVFEKKSEKNSYLAAILVGNDKSLTYVEVLLMEQVGFKSTLIRLESNITEEALLQN